MQAQSLNSLIERGEAKCESLTLHRTSLASERALATRLTMSIKLLKQLATSAWPLQEAPWQSSVSSPLASSARPETGSRASRPR